MDNGTTMGNEIRLVEGTVFGTVTVLDLFREYQAGRRYPRIEIVSEVVRTARDARECETPIESD